MTGAGRGIGLALAVASAKGGAIVTQAARNADEVAAGAREPEAGGPAGAAVLDMTLVDRAAIDDRSAQTALPRKVAISRRRKVPRSHRHYRRPVADPIRKA